MPHNSSDLIRKRLYDEYEDSLFRLFLHDAAEEEGKLLLEENERLKGDPAYTPSPEAIAAFQRRLDRYFKKVKRHTRMIRAAVLVAVLIALFISLMIGVQAFRVRVLNLWLDIRPQYTSFELRGEENDPGGDGAKIDWKHTYVPTYVPDGYDIKESEMFELMKIIQFVNEQDADSTILFTESTSAVKTAIDTENASMETIKINGRDGTLIMKNNMVTIVWDMDNLMFILQASNCPKDELMKMAEGVQYVE